MTELDVINDALATLGESPLVEVDNDHPLVPGIRRILVSANKAVQARGWWFNKESITLKPDADSSFIYVPNDALSCIPRRSFYDGTLLENSLPVVQRGRRLYDTRNNTYIFDKDIQCLLIRLVPFDDLPPSAQEYVSLGVSLQFQENYDADPNRTNLLIMQYKAAHSTLVSEHTRMVKANFLAKRSTARSLFNIGGNSYRFW